MRAYHFCPLDLPHVITLIYPVGQYGWEDYLGTEREARPSVYGIY
jgi:hypothetical protein